MMILDPERDEILEANAAAHEMLGYAREELLARRISDIHPTDMTRFLEFATEVVRDGEGTTRDLSCLTKSGRSVATETTASPIRLAGRTCVFALLRPIPMRGVARPALTRRSGHGHAEVA